MTGTRVEPVKPGPVPGPPGPRDRQVRDERLDEGALAELSFVPVDAEAVVRVDLAAFVAQDAKAAEAMDYVLRAQQPVAWRVLDAAGIHAGKELATIYLVVGAHAAAEDAFLLAGLGDIDVSKVSDTLRNIDEKAQTEPAPRGAMLFVWPKAHGDAVGASVPHVKASPLGDTAVGLADGLLLLGPPDLVRRALETRGGEQQEVRKGKLAAQLLAVESDAIAWGTLASDGKDAYAPTLAPGIRFAHFSAVPSRGGVKGSLRLRAEFASHEEAKAFHAQLRALLRSAAQLGDQTPVGAAIVRLKTSADITVEDRVVNALSSL